MNATQTRLHQIETRWTLVDRAHADNTLATTARHDLFDRYCGAAWRYLRALTRDESLAEDLFQEFALRLIRGDFHRAAAAKGRFRHYLKTVLIHLVKDHFRRRKRQPLPLPQYVPDPCAAPFDDEEPDAMFVESWRDDLLDRAWHTLQATHAVLHDVLKLHATLPDSTAREKADELSRRRSEPFTANRFRVTLHRARQKFAALLRDEVAASLENPSDEELESELRQLRLLSYCAQ